MRHRPLLRLLALFFMALLSLRVATWGVAQDAASLRVAQGAPPAGEERVAEASARPHYKIDAQIDYELLTFKSAGLITVPVARGDALRDVVFFIFANAGGVGGEDERRKNIVVDSVSLGGEKLPFALDGAVLRVRLPQPQSERFALRIDWHGVVPRSPAGGGGLADMMGGMGTDISGMLGGLMGGAAGGAGQAQQPAKPKNTDYGLYTYGNGVLSLGSFWYPSLAVRQGGKWIDDAPAGLGDVAYAEMSDFDVTLRVPDNVTVAAPGKMLTDRDLAAHRLRADDVRDFAVLMSEDYTVKAKTVDVGGRQVAVQAFTTRKNAAKADQAIDIAARALQIFAKRFGPYPYDTFKVAEGPMRGGAGGMEYSGMTAIASMLYEDWGKQLAGLTDALGLGALDKIMGGFDEDGGGAAQNGAADNAAGGFVKDMLGQQKEMLDSIFETTIAHEVAHQWWAIGVGSDSQRAPFVDESLTNYSAMLYFEDRYGKAKAEQMMDIHLRTAYSMSRMLGGADAPVNLRTAAYQNNLQYGAIVYGKGALFYDALRREVGDATFFGALREYYARYAGRLALPRALLELVQARAPAKADAVAALYRRWIEEAHGDDDITGGKPATITDLLGGLMGGGLMEDE